MNDTTDANGIHWVGPGREVTAIDGAFADDMAAAAHLAATTDARWLLCEERRPDPHCQDRLRTVRAYDDTSLATLNLRDLREHGHEGFLFDGRRDLAKALQRQSDGRYLCAMPDGRARRIASEWAEGKRSVLTALATSGAVLKGDAAEIRHLRAWAHLNGYGRDIRVALNALAEYVEEVGERDPIPGWADLWDDTPVTEEM